MSLIMIIEDDNALREQIKEVLEGYNYTVYAVTEFDTVVEQFEQVGPDLILMDLNLPRYDGNYYCKMIRRKSQVPIIITSARNGDMDQILSMELGADEYVVKPFNVQVLLAKINALMRRMYGDYSAPKEEETMVLHGIELNQMNFKVTYEGKTEELSKNEFKLLKRFLSQADTVIARETLLEEIWDMSSFVDDNTLTVNVTRLKNRLASLGMKNVIKTKRGAGYLFDTEGL